MILYTGSCANEIPGAYYIIILCGMTAFRFQRALCRRQHQFDPVQLIYLAGAGIVVDGYDIGLWISLSQRLDDALAHHMVGQAAEGLCADDVGHVIVDQLHHFPGQEPPLAGLVSDGYDRLGEFHDLPNGSGRRKVPACLEFFHRSAPQEVFDRPDAERGQSGCLFAGAQILRSIDNAASP